MPDNAKSLPEGLYESLVTTEIAASLAGLPDELIEIEQIDPDHAPDVISLHLGRQIERALLRVPQDQRLQMGSRIAEALMKQLDQFLKTEEYEQQRIDDRFGILKSISSYLPDGTKRGILEPLSSLAETTLITNSSHEPRVGSQLKREIASANSISIIMAFITQGGINQFITEMKQFCTDGRTLRILTTSFNGITQPKALEQLRNAGAEIRVSYDSSATRLHAKAWIFKRDSGFSTAFVGSSNWTQTAQSPGLEWNVRLSNIRNSEVIERMAAVFDSYWESDAFDEYDSAYFADEYNRLSRTILTPPASRRPISPLPFQQQMIEQLRVSRELGHHRNLLVAATGTGKTVVAALDYQHLASLTSPLRLLFIAHRQEILQQSLRTFQNVLQDYRFGELWVGGQHPSHFDHVFASIQSLNLSDIENLDPSRFDVVIVDEFHHAAADSYTKLLEHIQPKELLGLTATPERADGLSILGFFEGRIAAELRLWDAIDQQYLTPFSYFGISDGTDLSHIPWRRGAGYDIDSLTNVYTASSVWSAFVAKEFVAHIDDLDSVKALGFCVSIRHAEYMAQIFSARGIRAVCVSSQTEQTQRENALQELESGDIKVVFSVDIFNEGVDVPSVNTILLLRPTESATIFLQQIGRGLRKSRDKGSCLVLDFVGNQNAEFRFDLKFRALVGGSRKNLTHQIENGFPYLPSGCSLDLDQKSASVILASIRNALPSRISELVKEYHALLEVRPNPSLGEFLDYTGLALSDIYSNDRCWSDIVLAGGGVVEESGPEAKYLRKVAGRLTHLDDLGRLNFYSSLIRERKRQFKDDTVEFRFARMLIAQIFSSPIAMKSLPKDASIPDALEFLFQHKQVCRELLELFDVLKGSINHLGYPIRNRPVNPLQIHARYTRREILAAFGCGKDVLVPEWREGVKDVPNERADLFAFTFDKSSAGFSDSTRYKDYAISQDLIHWESQSTTRADGPVGMRYQNHVALGRDIFLFCRLTTDDRAFWFLGPATYLSHQGDRPMAVKWQLGTPLPGDLYTQFAAAVA